MKAAKAKAGLIGESSIGVSVKKNRRRGENVGERKCIKAESESSAGGVAASRKSALKRISWRQWRIGENGGQRQASGVTSASAAARRNQ